MAPTTGLPVRAADEDNALVIGPPRSGKTSGLIGPSVLAHRGPVVVTSSKPDVFEMTAAVRAGDGPIWVYAPGQALPTISGVRVSTAAWTPILGCRDWDTALLSARAMVGATVRHDRAGSSADSRFWYLQAARLLAASMHAAAVSNGTMAEVAMWILTGDLAAPAARLRAVGAGWAMKIVESVDGAEGRYRDSVLATASDVLSAYDSTAARAGSAEATFPVQEFLRRNGTLYIVAPTEVQELWAPLVVGLLDEIRRAVFASAPHPGADGRPGADGHTVLFALDEMARIAPLHNLPGWIAECGSHGLQVLGVLQDLSQAAERWGEHQANGFLTLFRHKILLPGVLDRATLESLSLLLGEELLSTAPGVALPRPRWPISTLSAPGAGRAVHVNGTSAELLQIITLHDRSTHPRGGYR